MHRTPAMTSGQARETIDRLSEQMAPLRRHGVAPEALIAEFNESLTAFVPRDKMPDFYVGKGRYIGDTARPGAYVQAGFFRHLVERARTDFDTLLIEWQRQTPGH
jgi:hypothetical protein